MKTRQEGGRLPAKERGLRRKPSLLTLALRLPAPRTVKNKLLWFKPPSLQWFAMAALANKHTVYVKWKSSSGKGLDQKDCFHQHPDNNTRSNQCLPHTTCFHLDQDGFSKAGKGQCGVGGLGGRKQGLALALNPTCSPRSLHPWGSRKGPQNFSGLERNR